MTNLRQRQPRIEDKAFLAFVRTQRCLVCNMPPPSQAAHLRLAQLQFGKRETGLGEKPDDKWTVPLCGECHVWGPTAQHKTGERVYWERLRIDPFAVAMRLYAEYQDGKRGRVWPGRGSFA